MPLDKDQIDQKLAQLEGYVSQIKTLGQRPEAEFTENSLVEAAAERVIYKSVQLAIDVTQSISSALGFGPPRFYRDLFTELGDRGIISKELQVRLEHMAGLRNKLAHEYARVKPEEIYRVVTEDHQDLVEFAKQISSYLTRSAH